MRANLIAVVVGMMTAVGMATSCAVAEPPGGVAVVELFTSEGCSSCPPADSALADLIRDTHGRPIYAMAFHVDYWDRLGWADAFADPLYSERQRQYGQALKLDAVYTPQVVVNGRREFVGSDRAKLKRAVAEAMAEPAIGTLRVNVVVAAGAARVELQSADLPPNTPVRVALVQRGLTTDVRRGENGGRKLPHENVVRAFVTVNPDAAGRATATLKIPAGVKAADLSVIAYAQRAADGRVMTAVDAALP